MLTSLALTFILASSGLAAVVPTILARSDVTDITFTGNGCPAGTTTSVVDDTTPSMTLLFSDFTIMISPEIVDPSERSCTVSFKVPQGFVYTYDTSIVGVSALDDGVSGTSVSTFSVNGNVMDTLSSSVTGPTHFDYFSFNNEFFIDSSAQESVVEIATQINIDSGSAPAFLVVDYMDLSTH